MGMTPREYFEAFVEGNADDCEEHPGCVRRAFNAAVSAAHLVDHFLKYNGLPRPELIGRFSTKDAFFEHIDAETNGASRDIRSIANAYKHLYTNSEKRDIWSVVASTGAIESIEWAGGGAEISAISEKPNGGGQEYVVVFSRKDGTVAQFLPALQQVVQYWRTVIDQTP